MRFTMGLDLGQASDYTAACVIERVPAEPRPVYHLRLLDRPPLKTPYPDIVATIKYALTSEPLKGASRLVVDDTGVGRAVYDLLVQAHLNPVGITITGGGTAHREAPNRWQVPKKELVSVLKVLYQTKRLQVAGKLPLAATFVQEMLAFRVKVNVASGHESYEAWREGAHDDLVLAAAMACWYAERGGGMPFSHVRLPEGPSETVTWPDGQTTTVTR